MVATQTCFFFPNFDSYFFKGVEIPPTRLFVIFVWERNMKPIYFRFLVVNTGATPIQHLHYARQIFQNSNHMQWYCWWIRNPKQPPVGCTNYTRVLKSCLNRLFCSPAYGAADFDKSCLLLKTHRHCSIFCACFLISVIWHSFVGKRKGTATIQDDFS